jgi:hypothetical protein
MNETLSASPAFVAPSFISMRRLVRTVLLVWAALAVSVSASGVLESAPPFIIPLLIGGTTLVFLATFAASPALRAYVLAADLRPAVLFHFVRAPIGVSFLVLHQGGQLPDAFVGAGWGDIAAGLAALPAVLALPAHTPAWRYTVLAWNVLALLDILWVIATAQQLLFFSGNPDSLVTLTRFPFSLLPLFIVPLVFITHFSVMAQLLRSQRGRGPRGTESPP